MRVVVSWWCGIPRCFEVHKGFLGVCSKRVSVCVVLEAFSSRARFICTTVVQIGVAIKPSEYPVKVSQFDTRHLFLLFFIFFLFVFSMVGGVLCMYVPFLFFNTPPTCNHHHCIDTPPLHRKGEGGVRWGTER